MGSRSSTPPSSNQVSGLVRAIQQVWSRHSRLLLLLAGFILLVIFQPPMRTLGPYAEVLKQALMWVGLVTCGVSTLWVLLDRVLDLDLKSWCGQWPSLLEFIVRWCFCLQLLLVLLLVFSDQAEAGVEWVVEHPQQAFLWGMVGAMIALVYWNFIAPPRRLVVKESRGFLDNEINTFVEPFDAYRTSVHEAGHALFLALFSDLPTQCTVRVRDPGSLKSLAAHQLGVVTLSFSAHEFFNELGMKMRMRMVMAGVLAERLVLGNASSGATSDHHTWSCLAHRYLSNGFEGLFFPSPGNSDERWMNLELLRQFHEQMEKEVSQFLLANRDVLLELAAEVMKHHTLEVEQLEPFIRRVRVPSGWVLPRMDEPTQPVSAR